MRKDASPVVLLEALDPGEERENGRARALLAVIAGGAALLILFAWLHLIVATQITSTNRAIQEAHKDLARLERENATVVRDITAAEAQETMAGRAAALGYAPQVPLYLPLAGAAAAVADPASIAASTRGGGRGTGAETESTAATGTRNPAAEFLLEAGSSRRTAPGAP